MTAGQFGRALVLAGGALLLSSLFMPWYEVTPVLPPLPPGGDVLIEPQPAWLSAWEAFHGPDVSLAAGAVAGVALGAGGFAFTARWPFVVWTLVGWSTVPATVYWFFDNHLVPGLSSSQRPQAGFFVALAAGGAMAVGSLSALRAPAPRRPGQRRSPLAV